MKNSDYFGYIYKIIIKNKKSKLYKHFYIGKKQGSVENSKNYYGSGIIINDYCYKHSGRPSRKLREQDVKKLKLEKIILDYAYSSEELNNLEKKYIAKDKNSELCLNLTNGGDGHSGIPWNKGLTKETDERVAKIGASMSGKNNHWYGKKPWNSNIKYTKEQKEKISKATKDAMAKLPQDKKDKMKSKVGHKGTIPTAETRAKLSKANSGKKYFIINGRRVWESDISYINKQVICKNDNRKFLNVIEAANHYKISTRSVVSSCKDSAKYVLINDQRVYFTFA